MSYNPKINDKKEEVMIVNEIVAVDANGAYLVGLQPKYTGIKTNYDNSKPLQNNDKKAETMKVIEEMSKFFN